MTGIAVGQPVMQRANWMHQMGMEYIALKREIIRERWPVVLNRGHAALGLAHSRILAGLAARDEARALNADVNAAGAALADGLEALARTSDGQAALKKAIAEVADADQEFLDGLEQVSEGDTRNVGLLRELRNGLGPVVEDEHVEHSTVGLASRGLLAQYQAEFNQSFFWPTGSYGVDQVAEALEATTRAVAARVRAAEADLHAAIVEARGTRAPALALATTIEIELPRLGRAHAAALRVAREGRTRNKGRATASTIELAQELMRSAEMGRRALAAQAAAYRLALGLREVDGEMGTAAELVGSAGTIPFDPSDEPAEPRKLTSLRRSRTGTVMSVSGWVTVASARRTTDRKLLGFAEIVDSDGKNPTQIVAIYTHLAHLGIVPGAYVEVTGEWRKRSALTGGPALEVDQVSLKERAEGSWRAALVWSAADYYRAWPNGVALSWTPGPQRFARKEGELNYLGAGESLWPPLVRGKGKRYVVR